MSRSNGVRGSRIGAGPMGESDRGNTVERVVVTFWCADGHATRAVFAAEAVAPESWECRECRQPAGPDRDNPPSATPAAPFKTHLEYVRERRSDADGEKLLTEALARFRQGR